MNKSITLVAALLLCIGAAAQVPAGWLRRSDISPDGQKIAFSYQGDIFTVSIDGGTAVQLTSNPAYDSEPLWTPDGKSLVFSSYRELGKDLWVISADGGTPRRLTTFPGAETPLAVLPDGRVLFQANIQPDPAYGNLVQDSSTPLYCQVYSVKLEGGKPEMVVSLPVGALSVNADGVMVYEDIKGYEDALRKHHTSSVTRDIWKMQDGVFTKLSDFEGEDRNPVFAPDGKTFYFLSEKGGNFNVWSSSIDDPGTQKQLTSFPVHPVRYLSASREGTLLFSYNGSLYTFRPGSEPRRLEISVLKDKHERDRVTTTVLGGVRSFAEAPGGKEVAVVSKGEVYVASVDADATRRITDTPEQERGISFSKDGRTLYYASERDGEWAIWKTELADKKDKYFSVSYNYKESRVTPPGQTCMQPEVSPDGKWLAYLRDRTEVVVMDIKSGKEKSLLKDVNYSYSDGDMQYAWSPDSRYILSTYMGEGGWHSKDIVLLGVEDGSMVNITRSGYTDAAFRWALNGKAMTWASDRAGYRSHGSWGAEDDVYIMFFDNKAYADFFKTKAVEDIEKLMNEGDKQAQKEEKKEKKDSADMAAGKFPKLELNLRDLEDRTVRLTRSSGRMGDYYLTDDGTKLYYTVTLEKGMDLCCLDLKDNSIKVVRKGVSGRFVPSKDGKYIYIPGSLSITRMDVKSGATKAIVFAGEFEYDAAAERSYIFHHAWKQVDEKFYDATIHGIDWAGFRDNYAAFLPYITNNFDFQELLSELLGELNASHTGARYSHRVTANAGRLGVLYDESYDGKGLRIKEILPGSQLTAVDPDIAAGDLILAVDGKEVEAGTKWYEALDRKASKRTLLKVRKGKKEVDILVTPGTSDSQGLYRRWVKQREEMVERLSGGRIGYVHVKGMDSDSFRSVYTNALGKYRGCEALIVDTRNNGGGWLHDDLATFLNGKAYIEFRPRGQYISTEPFNKWTKPSCVLIGENNYSDACGFPYVYRALGIGKLIGAPVPGTMTAVWWETQVDNTLVFGIPEVTSWGLAEDRPLENFQIEPDILVYNDPASVLRGEDRQLEAAVAEMLREIDKK